MSHKTQVKHDFDIAIIGGGIAGVTLALGLLKNNIPVTIYESAHKFGEIGAGVFFAPNAIRAMDGIDPRITAGFHKVANYNKLPELHDVYFDFRYGEGPRAGELITRPRCPGDHAGVHRARFLEELTKLVPDGISHFGKRLTDLEKVGEKYRLTFKDGTTAEHDCVIGCDGVHSVVRKFVLGPDDPNLTPVFSGGYCHRGLLPMEEAISILGEEMALNAQNHVGHGSHFLTFPVDNYKTFNAVAFGTCEKWEEEKWVVHGDVKNIYEDFKTFGPMIQKVIERMRDTDIWAIFESPPARTLYNGNLAIIGDAAHATGPWQGSGAAFAIEDAYVLSSLMGHVQNISQLESCLKAFDAVRKERDHKLVTTSHEAGMTWNLENPETGDDYDKLKANADSRFLWIWTHDHEPDIEQGLKLMGL